jgi:hypothetical protein
VAPVALALLLLTALPLVAMFCVVFVVAVVLPDPAAPLPATKLVRAWYNALKRGLPCAVDLSLPPLPAPSGAFDPRSAPRVRKYDELAEAAFGAETALIDIMWLLWTGAR